MTTAANARLFVTFYSSIKGYLLCSLLPGVRVKQKQADLVMFLCPFHFYANQIVE